MTVLNKIITWCSSQVRMIGSITGSFKQCVLLPEEGVMLHTHFPQLLGGLVVWQFETNGTFVMLQLLETKAYE